MSAHRNEHVESLVSSQGSDCNRDAETDDGSTGQEHDQSDRLMRPWSVRDPVECGIIETWAGYHFVCDRRGIVVALFEELDVAQAVVGIVNSGK